MKRLIFSILCVYLASTLTLGAANYFIAFEPSCMNRYEYGFPETPLGNEIVMYSLPISSSERLFLRVGIEGAAAVQGYPPANVLNCNSTNLAALAKDWFSTINNRIDQVYIVSTVGSNQYRIAPVETVFYFKTDGRDLVINTNLYRLQFRPTDLANRQGDLSNYDARGSVFFLREAAAGTCPGYVFRQTNPALPNKFTDIYVVPNVGIIEEQNSAVNSNFKLKRINNQDLAAYLERNCQGNAVPFSYAGANPSAVPQEYNAYNNETWSKGGGVAAPSNSGTHVVVSGDNLYRLSRTYNLSVEQLKQWNNLISDELRPGMVLRLAPTASTYPPATYPATDQPTAYSTITSPTMGWLNAAATHTVQYGETLASLAERYGYTEARFRYFNNLNPGEALRPGQILRTSDCPPPHRQGNEPAATYPASTGYQGANEFTPRSVAEDPYGTGAAPSSYDYYSGNSRAENPRRYHLVAPGETLESIAQKYRLTTQFLRQRNNLQYGEEVLAGRQLLLE